MQAAQWLPLVVIAVQSGLPVLYRVQQTPQLGQ